MAGEHTYKRLAGGSVRRFVSQRLWLGTDHILVIASQFLTERYKRFYFQDIQAITVTRSSLGVLLGVILAILAGFFALWAVLGYLLLDWTPLPTAIVGGIGIVWVLLFFVNLLLGPTCRCYLYTAVNCEELYALGRVRTARRAIERLRPLIEAAQGGRLPDAQLDELSTTQGRLSEPRMAPTAGAASLRPGQQTLRQESGTVHAALFSALIADAAVSLVALVQPQMVPMPLGFLMLILVIGLTVAALVKQINSTIPRQLRNVTWVCFVYVCLVVLFYYAFMFVNQVGAEMGGEDMPPGIETLQTRLRQIVSAISIVFDIILSVFGFRMLWDYRNRTQRESAMDAQSPVAAPERE